MIELQWTISVGTIIHAAALILTLVGMWVKLNTRLTRLETMLDPIWKWWNSNGDEPTISPVEAKIDHAIRTATQKAVFQALEQAERRRRGDT